ncbi:hypothetical protein Tco_0827198, partial [Tanacetum coccineum]
LGLTAIGLKAKEGVVLVVEKLITSPLLTLLDDILGDTTLTPCTDIKKQLLKRLSRAPTISTPTKLLEGKKKKRKGQQQYELPVDEEPCEEKDSGTSKLRIEYIVEDPDSKVTEV